MTTTTWARIDSIGSLEPRFVAPDTKLRRVAELMWQEPVGLLLVGHARELLGVISERDLVGALARGVDPDRATAAGVMTSDVVSLRPDDTVYDAAIDMLDVGVRHVPIVDRHGHVRGVVSVRDLLRPLVVAALEG